MAPRGVRCSARLSAAPPLPAPRVPPAAGAPLDGEAPGERRARAAERAREVEDGPRVLRAKCRRLARACTIASCVAWRWRWRWQWRPSTRGSGAGGRRGRGRGCARVCCSLCSHGWRGKRCAARGVRAAHGAVPPPRRRCGAAWCCAACPRPRRHCERYPPPRARARPRPIWSMQLSEEECTWRHCWSTSVRARGWESVERALFASGGARLLLAGTLALAPARELMVLQLDEEGVGHVLSRARCGPGAGGCWVHAGGDAYLSLELRVLAPRLACTTVILNAATQETESEYDGVTSPLLRIFNEGGAPVTLAVVVETPSEPDAAACSPAVEDPADVDDHEQYFRAMTREASLLTAPLLLTSSGGGGVGNAGVLSTWRLRARRPAPLQARRHGELAARWRARAAAVIARGAREGAPEPAPPTEAAVRALCDVPCATRALPSLPLCLVPLPSGCGAWVSLSGGGAWCVSLPALCVLRRVCDPAGVGAGAAVPLQGSLSDLYFVSPTGAGAVRVWSAWSGAPCEGAPPTPATPATAALLVTPRGAARPLLLVLAGDAIHVWRSRATSQPASDELL